MFHSVENLRCANGGSQTSPGIGGVSLTQHPEAR